MVTSQIDDDDDVGGDGDDDVGGDGDDDEDGRFLGEEELDDDDHYLWLRIPTT